MGDPQTDLRPALEAQGYSLEETHISRVFLRGPDVFKTKRAVDLGFLDFTTLGRRLAACEAEVRLNARLAPGVYHGVVAAVRALDGSFEFVQREALADRPVVEWAVHMKRLEQADRADELLRLGQLGGAEIDRIARMLARFHERVGKEPALARFGSRETIRQNVEENFEQVRPFVGACLSEADFAHLVSYQRDFLRDHAALLEQRVAAGRVRDGHGDLRLEHLYRQADGEFVAIDCIEFSDRFRYADVAADLAFLAMDLRFQGKPGLSERLLASYARESRDYGLYGVVDFYQSYRALVRAKVASILSQDTCASEVRQMRAQDLARRYYRLALDFAGERPDPPWLVLAAGVIASGKSTIARELSGARALPWLSADPTRKELLGTPPETSHHDRPFQGAYAPEMSERVYETLRDRAAAVLRSGRSVIVDASFRARAEREAMRRLARELGARLLVVECRCSREALVTRLRKRAQGPSVSDGREEILDDFVRRFEPLAEVAPDELLSLDTEQPLSSNLERCLQRLEV